MNSCTYKRANMQTEACEGLCHPSVTYASTRRRENLFLVDPPGDDMCRKPLRS